MTAVTRILVPPGIGDIYWVLVKLRGLASRYNWARPELTVVTQPDPMNRHLHSVPYLEMFDWFDIGDPSTVANATAHNNVWEEGYSVNGRPVFENIQGYDAFISYNGRLNNGGYLEDDSLPCEWHPMMSASTETAIQAAKSAYENVFGRDAVVLYFPFYGSYINYEREFPISTMATAINKFTSNTALLPVVVGAAWDDNAMMQNLLNRIDRPYINLLGKTDLSQVFAVLRAARIVIGYQAGPVQLAAGNGKKTLLLWDGRFHDNMMYSIVPPDVRGTSYRALKTAGLTADTCLDALMDLYVQ